MAIDVNFIYHVVICSSSKESLILTLQDFNRTPYKFVLLRNEKILLSFEKVSLY